VSLNSEAQTRSDVLRAVVGAEPIRPGRSLENTSRRRSSGREPLSNRHVSILDWKGIEIIINTDGS
jgi:hypothetical protein